MNSIIHIDINSPLTEKEPWRVDALFDLIWWDIKESLKIEQDKRKLDKIARDNPIPTLEMVTKFLFENKRFFIYGYSF